MISNFFVLSPRGDTIIFKQYRSSSSTNGNNSTGSDPTESSSGTTASSAHERSNTEAFFRKIKFWDDTSMMTFSSMNALDSYMTQQLKAVSNNNTVVNSSSSNNNNNMSSDPNMNDPSTTGTDSSSSSSSLRTGDAPPVFPMPDGHTYLHIKRNGLIFAASTVRNSSPNTVLEVREDLDSFSFGFGFTFVLRYLYQIGHSFL